MKLEKIKLELTISKRKNDDKEKIENQSVYNYAVKIDKKVFYLIPRSVDVSLLDYLLMDSEEFPEEVEVLRQYFENDVQESVRFYSVRLEVGEDRFPLNVVKDDKRLFNYLVDSLFKAEESEE